MKTHHHPHHPALRALPAVLALACASPAALAQSSPWYVGVSQAFTHESNLYRIDDGVVLGPGFSRSDNVSTTSLVAGLDQPIGRQRLYGNATLGYNRYSRNEYLDDSSYSLTAGLDWSSIERLSGNVSAAASQRQRQFNVDTLPGVAETRKNSERVQQFDTTVRVGGVTRLTLEAGLGVRRLDYSAPVFAGSEYQQTRVSAGVRYRPGIATFGAVYVRAESDYDSGGEQVVRDSLDLTVNWPATGNSTLYARISPTRVSYEQFTERDYSGLTGALRWDWTPTGKLTFATRLVHDVGQDSSFETFGGPVVVGTSNTSRTTTELRLDADYEATAKIVLNASASTAHRKFEQTASTVPGVTPASGSDATTALSLGVRWAPLRSVMVGCNAGLERRSTQGALTQAYDAKTFGCYGRFTLQ